MIGSGVTCVNKKCSCREEIMCVVGGSNPLVQCCGTTQDASEAVALTTRDPVAKYGWSSGKDAGPGPEGSVEGKEWSLGMKYSSTPGRGLGRTLKM